MSQPELLTNPENLKFNLFSIRFPDIFDFYNIHKASYWTPEELDYSKDLKHWHNLNEDERTFIKYTNAFFAGSDFIVNENQAKDAEQITLLEYKFFNDDKIARENIHSHTYADMINAYVTDEDERKHLFDAVDNIETIKLKADWM